MKNTNILVLDTTFVLPLFGIEVLLTPTFQEEIKELWTNGINGYKVYVPSTCLIETNFKLLSEYRKREDFGILDRYQLILPTVLNSPFKIFNPELNPKASLIAAKIRHSGHTDFMDCWIAASAMVLNGVLLSEERNLN